jgi:hypothetical protein
MSAAAPVLTFDNGVAAVATMADGSCPDSKADQQRSGAGRAAKGISKIPKPCTDAAVALEMLYFADYDFCNTDRTFALSKAIFLQLQRRHKFLEHITYAAFKKARENLLLPSRREVTRVRHRMIRMRRIVLFPSGVHDYLYPDEEDNDSPVEMDRHEAWLPLVGWTCRWCGITGARQCPVGSDDHAMGRCQECAHVEY